MNLLQQFQAHLRQTQLFTSGDRLLLALSGGLDSVVLLDLLLRSGYRPALAHCDFQLRGTASTADAAFVAELATRHELVLHGKRFATTAYAREHGRSLQMAARELRYAWFEELQARERYDYVLTAHHLDDQLETFLLNFLRGTGLRGLGGIPASRDFYRRPLLFARRADLEAYQQAQGLVYREDESNASDHYQRNYLRHHVLPHLYVLQPSLGQVATANFARLRQARALLADQLEVLRKQCCQVDEQGREVWDRLAIEAHPQGELLCWEWFSPRGFTAEQLRQLSDSQSGTILRAGQWDVLVTAAAWLFQRRASGVDPDWSQSWPATVGMVPLPDGRQLCREEVGYAEFAWPADDSERIYVDRAALQYPLTLRYRRPGDTFCPLGMEGRQQKLKDFFINQKVDRWQRDRTPLLLNGDGRIIWVVGYRLDERFKVQAPERVTCLQLLPKLTPES